MTSPGHGEPVITDRAAQPYAATRVTVPIQTISAAADRIPVVLGWLSERGIQPAGAPFLRYVTVAMDAHIEIEAGVPVAAAVEPSGGVFGGTLPAGSYATVVHHGHYDGLAATTADLLEWASDHGLRWDSSIGATGAEQWACRLEIYQTNPLVVPDPASWQTPLAFRLAD